MMSWLRELFWLSATKGFRLTARHVEGKVNVMADALSRFDHETFRINWCLWKEVQARGWKLKVSDPAWIKLLVCRM